LLPKRHQWLEKLPNGVDAVEEEEAAGAEEEPEEDHPKGDTDAEDVAAAAVEEDVDAGGADAAVVAHAIEEGKLLSKHGELEWPNVELP
jgi:hypothetical protein